MADKVRWGVLSTARIGKLRVIPAIQQSSNGEVVAVASRDQARAQAFADELGIPQAYGSYEDLINSGEVDAIYNPLPNSMHAEWSIACAEAGVATLCEKPLASNAEEAQGMVDAFNKRGVLFAEAFMYRFHPQTQLVLQMIRDGAVGNIQAINAAFSFSIGDEGNIRLQKELAGGALMDVGCYCINAMRLLTGEEPDGGQAFAVFGTETDVDENISGVLSFPSGVLGYFNAGLRHHRVHTYEVRGDNGRIVLEAAFVPNADQATVIRYWQSERDDGGYEEIAVDPANQYTIMAEDFADALINNRPPAFPSQDAVDNMFVIENLLASARSGDGYWF